MKRAGDILSACGPMLGPLDQQNARVLKSLAYVLEPGGLWEGFDHVADVLPVVKLKTGPGCGRVLWDFALLTANLEKQLAKRLKPAGKAVARGGRQAPAELSEADKAAKREARMKGLRATIAAIDRGEGQPFMLPKSEQHWRGEFLEDAYARERKRCADELAGLELVASANTVGG